METYLVSDETFEINEEDIEVIIDTGNESSINERKWLEMVLMSINEDEKNKNERDGKKDNKNI